MKVIKGLLGFIVIIAFLTYFGMQGAHKKYEVVELDYTPGDVIQVLADYTFSVVKVETLASLEMQTTLITIEVENITESDIKVFHQDFYIRDTDGNERARPVEDSVTTISPNGIVNITLLFPITGRGEFYLVHEPKLFVEPIEIKV